MPKIGKHNRRNVLQVDAERRGKIAEMYCAGKSQATIAAEFKLSVGRISQILQECRDEWRARRDVATDDQISLSLLKLDQVYKEAMEGWERSYQDAVTLTSKKVKPRAEKVRVGVRVSKVRKELQLISQEEKRVGQAGDPAFLHVAKSVVDTRLKLLGAFPKEDKTEVTNIIQFNWKELVDPIACVQPIASTPSSEIEARIRQELNSPPPPNGNGQH